MQDKENKIPNIFLKLAYSELLLSYKTEDLVTLVQNANISSTKLIECAWQDNESVSVEDNAVVIDSFAKWLLSKGENLDDFSTRMFNKMTHVNQIPKRAVMRSYLPFIRDFYDQKDQRLFYLQCEEKRNLFKQNYSFIESSAEKDMRHDFLVNQASGANRPNAVYASWLLQSLSCGPQLLGLPSYEKVTRYSCLHTAEEALLGRLAGSLDNDTFYVSGIAVGKTTKFGELLEKLPQNLGLSKLADKPCIRLDTDVIDTITGTHLLYKGLYYGAPASICEFVYAKDKAVKDPFAGLISALVQEEYNVWPPVQKAHDELLHKVNHVAEIIYYEADDSISVNGKHLMRNVPARILRNILREYTRTGREEFENREFKRDPEICIDPVNPNFESRLNRVVDHLEKVSDVMGLNRHRRGGFRFEPHCHIDFREEPAIPRKKVKDK